MKCARSLTAGDALRLPKELLGDVYADPYEKPKRGGGSAAGQSLSKADVAALKEEVRSRAHPQNAYVFQRLFLLLD